MKIEEVLEWITKPDELIDPKVVDELLFWTSGFLGDYEERLSVIDQQVAVKYDDLAIKWGSDAAGKRKLALEPIYQEQRQVERKIKQLKAFKTNLRRRYEILTGRFN